MLVAPHDDDLDHGRLAAFLGRESSIQMLHVLAHEAHIQLLRLAHPLLVQHEHDRRLELVPLELGFHALLQAVVVPLVAEGILDLDDVAVGPAHQAFDEELPPRAVGLVPEVGPVSLALPSAQRDRVGGFAQIAGHLHLDVLGDVDTFALGFHVLLVLGAEHQDVIIGEMGQDLDQRLGVDGRMLECACQGESVRFGVVEGDFLLGLGMMGDVFVQFGVLIEWGQIRKI